MKEIMEWWHKQTAIDKVRLIDKYEIKTERINSLDISEINVMKIYDAELPEEKVSQSIEDYLGAKYKDELVRIDALEDVNFGIDWQNKQSSPIEVEKDKIEFAISKCKEFRECAFGKGINVIKELEDKLNELIIKLHP